jgi:hypothetical protein
MQTINFLINIFVEVCRKIRREIRGLFEKVFAPPRKEKIFFFGATLSREKNPIREFGSLFFMVPFYTFV